MNNFIEVTRGEKKILINVSLICYAEPGTEGCKIYLNTFRGIRSTYNLKESYEEVKSLIEKARSPV